MSRPVILIFTGYYVPGFRGGGPIKTIANLVSALGDEFEFKIITSDRDLGDVVPYKGVEINSWNSVGKASVYYASASSLGFFQLREILANTEYDILYLNSFFSYRFSILPSVFRRFWLIPVKPAIIAPRGEFSSGAFSLKIFKKRIFHFLATLIDLHRGMTWQASSVFELSDIQKKISKNGAGAAVAAKISIAPDLCSLDDAVLSGDDCGGPFCLKVCFLARVVPIKNLAFALRVLAKTKINVEFSIYGPIEDERYWDACGELIAAMPPNIVVHYKGAVESAAVRGVIAQHDLFFVPTQGENFGHVFFEALSAGVPILLSDQTPWRDLPRKGVGWDISLESIDEFVAAIEQAHGWTSEKRNDVAHECVLYAQCIANDAAALQANRMLFLDALAS